MTNTKRNHYFTPSWWIGFFFLGTLDVAISVNIVSMNYHDLLTTPWTLWEYIGVPLVCSMFAFGVLMLVAPFVIKVVISPQGIEYHTISYIVRLTWQNISNEQPENWASDEETNEEIAADIYVRPWARFNSIKVKRQAVKNGIPLSWFGGIGGRRLKADLRKFAPHLNL